MFTYKLNQNIYFNISFRYFANLVLFVVVFSKNYNSAESFNQVSLILNNNFIPESFNTFRMNGLPILIDQSGLV